MPRYEILDTFPGFERYWRRVRALPVDQQVESWRRDYLQPWPELFRKQAADYRGFGVDWRRIAKRRIFPALDERLARMRRVRASIRRAIPVAVDRAWGQLGLDFRITFVIHVGIGCGAGWATTFDGGPAVLFGIENAAELGWTDTVTTVALVEHEIAHLLHDHWRRSARLGGIEGPSGPWWQLYEEGFATHCELLLGGVGKHHSTRETRDWSSWCEKNRSRLASLFLRAVRSRRSTRRFFGSWQNVDGYVNTGYFLGSEMIREWESQFSLREIAVWTADQVRRRAKASIQRFAAAT